MEQFKNERKVYTCIARTYFTTQVLTECSKCGTYHKAKVYCDKLDWEELYKTIREDIPHFCKCKVCNSKIFEEKYSVWGDNDESEEVLKNQLQEKKSNEARADIAKKIANTKPIADMPVKNKYFEKVKADIPSLKAYMHQIIDIEVWKCFLKEHIIKITYKKNEINKNKIFIEETAKNKMEAEEKSLLEKTEKLQSKLESTDWVSKVERVKITAPEKPKYLKEEKPQEPTPPVMKTPNFLNKKRVLAKNERLQQKYEEDCRIYEKKLKAFEDIKSKNALLRKIHKERMQEYKEKLAAEDARIEAEATAKKEEAQKKLDKKLDKIKGEINVLEKLSKSGPEISYIESVLNTKKDESLKLLKTLNKLSDELFSINVIYPNYRDVFALTSFYEYFNSERCYELEGPDGAYNLYESERRSDAFSTFFRKLEDINKNQIVLYREASIMFDNLKLLDDSLEKTIESIEKKEIKNSKNSEKIINESFETYFENYEKFTEKIKKSIESANEILA